MQQSRNVIEDHPNGLTKAILITSAIRRLKRRTLLDLLYLNSLYALTPKNSIQLYTIIT